MGPFAVLIFAPGVLDAEAVVAGSGVC
jgi:hypothetical protein